MKRWILVFSLCLFGFSNLQADEVPDLLSEASKLVDLNQTDKALDVYMKVLDKDVRNYTALVYVCGYHYNKGMAQLNKLETNFRVFRSPNRMQTARFENALKELYETHFKRSEEYLVKAYLIRKNEHLDNMAGVIADLKKRIGLMQETGNKK